MSPRVWLSQGTLAAGSLPDVYPCLYTIAKDLATTMK